MKTKKTYSKDKKLRLIILGLLVLCLGLMNAAWLMTLETSGIYLITSSAPELGFTTFFSGALIDTSETNQTFTDTALISNPIDDTWVLVTITEERVDGETGCTDYLEDCSLNFEAGFVGGSGFVELIDGEYIMLKTGDTEIKTHVSCKRFSCSQNITAEVSLTPDYEYFP